MDRAPEGICCGVDDRYCHLILLRCIHFTRDYRVDGTQMMRPRFLLETFASWQVGRNTNFDFIAGRKEGLLVLSYRHPDWYGPYCRAGTEPRR